MTRRICAKFVFRSKHLFITTCIKKHCNSTTKILTRSICNELQILGYITHAVHSVTDRLYSNSEQDYPKTFWKEVAFTKKLLSDLAFSPYTKTTQEGATIDALITSFPFFSFQLSVSSARVISIDQMTQEIRRLLLVLKVWGSNLNSTKSLTRCQQLVTIAILMCGPWCKSGELGTAHSWHPKEY